MSNARCVSSPAGSITRGSSLGSDLQQRGGERLNDVPFEKEKSIYLRACEVLVYKSYQNHNNVNELMSKETLQTLHLH